MYRKIRKHVTTGEIYAQKMLSEGVVSQADIEKMRADWRANLETEFEAGQAYKPNKADWLDGAWSGLKKADNEDEQRRGKTAVPLKTLKEIGKKLAEVPEGFEAHRTVQRFLANRKKMIDSGAGLDWATAEALAFGSILLDGNPVRAHGPRLASGWHDAMARSSSPWPSCPRAAGDRLSRRQVLIGRRGGGVGCYR